MKLNRVGLHVLVGVGLCAAVAGPVAAVGPQRPAGPGPTFTVNNLSDAPAGGDPSDGICQTSPINSQCTLRAAIMEANHVPGGGATIIVPAGVYALTIAPSGPNDETTGDLNMTALMFIQGAGAGSTIVDGGGLDRVLTISTSSGLPVTLADLTIRNGSSATSGGGLAIFNPADLMRVVVSGNESAGHGGGIANYNELSLERSLVSHNRSAGDGGGIYTDDLLLIENSTISNNAAQGNGGGIYIQAAGALELALSTVAGNLADSDNTAGGAGGGLYTASGLVYLQGTLLAENLAGPLPRDCAGLAIELSHRNLIQTGLGCTLTVVGTGNQVGVNPQLLPLQDNTGSSPTRALLAGSPAIEAGICSGYHGVVGTDQRGAPRPAGAQCDIGAYEGSVPAGWFGRNLLHNGDAEAAAGSPTGSTAGWPGWTLAEGTDPAVLPYGIPGGWPLATDPGPANRGENYFAGALADDAYLMQTFDVSAIAVAINSGSVRYAFAGYLGGYANQEDQATAYLTFRNGATAILGNAQLGPVTNTDRGNQTGLLPRSAAGVVPAGTVTIEVELRLTAVASSYNDGYADNLSLVLGSQIYLPLALR